MATHILAFLQQLQIDFELPPGVEVMNPFADAETKRICEAFYNRFYKDQNPRCCIIGINPGRFGGGVTGISFTDPIRLERDCHIENTWPKKQELSSVFIYDMIHAFGGVEKFYSRFYITSVSPLGFTKNGVNLNYYDDPLLTEKVRPFAVQCFRQQIAWGLHTKVAFCMGEGRNYRFVNKLNKEYRFFEEVVPLSHPRFIMQYKLKKKEEYIQNYLEAFARCTASYATGRESGSYV